MRAAGAHGLPRSPPHRPGGSHRAGSSRCQGGGARAGSTRAERRRRLLSAGVAAPERQPASKTDGSSSTRRAARLARVRSSRPAGRRTCSVSPRRGRAGPARPARCLPEPHLSLSPSLSARPTHHRADPRPPENRPCAIDLSSARRHAATLPLPVPRHGHLPTAITFFSFEMETGDSHHLQSGSPSFVHRGDNEIGSKLVTQPPQRERVFINSFRHRKLQ